MRVYIFILLLFTFIPTAFAQESLYICPMHPHISGEEGETCPICGMDFVQRSEQSSMPLSEEKPEKLPSMSFKIDPTYTQALGVKTGKAIKRDFGKNIRAFGKMASSTRLEYAIDVRTKGWIVDLETDAVGDIVKEGDLLFNYYSPRLMEAQSDFFLARRPKDPEQRLRLFGMGEKAIKDLKKKGRFLEKTPFYAPADGAITKLNVRKGSHMQEGGSVMTIQDFSKIWINADVPIRDVQFLELGTIVNVIVPETGDEYQTIIDFIHPISNSKTRTAMVRMVIDNTKGDLKPETYVDVTFEGNIQSRLSVPQEAILYSSLGAYLIQDLGEGYFSPVMVDIGITSNGFTEIKGGVSDGTNIVTSGQFMLDAESNLRGGMAAMGHDHGATKEVKETKEEGHIHGQH